MEPLAPGTEDEPVCNQELRLNKKDTAEELALSKKAFLRNGTYGNIFLLEYVQGAQHWFCRVCERPVFGRVFNHEIGKRHLALLRLSKNDDVPDDDGDAENKDEVPGMGMVVAPGEPLPPGFEGEVEQSKTIIQDRLDKFKGVPLLGLEYLLELLDYDPSKEPSYMCILCHKKGDPRTILTHLASYNHQVTYLQKHFPTAYRHIAPFMVKVYKRNWQSGLQRIAEAIEATFGRLKPIQVEATKYNKDAMHYIGLVAKGKHFSELSGHTFENIVSKEDLTKVYEEPKIKPTITTAVGNVQKRKSPSPPVVAKPVKRPKPPVAETKPKRRSLSPVSDVSSCDLDDFDPQSPQKFSKVNENFGRTPAMNKSTFVRKEGSMPWQKSSYRRDRPQPIIEKNRDDKSEKMEEFKRLSKAIDNQMQQVLNKNKENPEKHPKYNDEWKKFWNSRYKELQSQGKNASTHDFKPEWIEFWNKRMLELHQEEIKTSKIALRKRLGLPEEPAPISFKIGERRKPLEVPNRPVPTAAQPDNDPEVIIIDDFEDDTVTSRDYVKKRSRSKSPFKRTDRSPQFRRRSPIRHKNPSPPTIRRKSSPLSPLSRRRESPPIHRRVSPTYRSRDSPPPRRRESPYSSRRDSPPRIKDSPKRQLSPLSRRKNSPTMLRAPSPPLKRIKDEKLRSLSPVRDRSPRRDKYERLRERSEERSRSRGKSREISWEKERERRRDYDEKHWDRAYMSREAPWERDHHYPIDPYAPPKILRDVTRKPVMMAGEEPEEEEGDVNIVAVLRLLTALEEKLGSLGPKVIDLLGQALAMEKKTANSSEELLDNEMNCVLFETVKEKLKGQLQAGLVDWIQEKAFKTAIKKTANLIHIAGQRKKQKEEELPKKPVVVPGIGKVDKGKIARQIANALIAQGKTDVTQNELEELINAVVGIAEAQKNSSETLTTAGFLEKLSNSQLSEKPETPKPDPEPEEKEKEIVQNLEEDHEASSSSQDKTTINMEGLSDSDLETLLQNFKDLSSDEQLGLINYLKKLEAKEPERVEKLRKFVNLPENSDEKSESGRYSPFSVRMEASSSLSKNEEDEKKDEGVKKDESEKKNDEVKEDNSGFINIDSDDEYSFEDVAKAVSQKVIENEREQKKQERQKEDKNLDDAKAFITSLMSSLNKNATSSSTSISTPSISTTKMSTTEKVNVISNVPVNPVSSADIAKSLSGITMSVSSLGNILGNIQNLTNKSQVEEQVPKQQLPKQLSNTTNPSSSTGTPRNTYNDFDITSQRDVRSKPEFNAKESVKNQQNKPYDEFNIGPITRNSKDEIRDIRPHGPLNNRFPDKPLGLPAPSNRLPQLDRNAPSNIQGGPLRGNPIQEKPSPPFTNQYPPRGAPFPNKMRPGGNNFETIGVQGDFGTRSDNFRGAMSDQRGVMTEQNLGMPDHRGGMSDHRGGMPDQRGGMPDHRGRIIDQRGGMPDHRGGMPDQRGRILDQSGVMSDQRGGMPAHRGGMPDHRGMMPDQRGGMFDSRGGMDNFRGMTDYRGGPNEYEESYFRGNDYREDMRGGPQGNFQRVDDDMRNNASNRGGYGYPRGVVPPHKGGNFNNANSNFAPTPRYPGNSNYNPYNKW